MSINVPSSNDALKQWVNDLKTDGRLPGFLHVCVREQQKQIKYTSLQGVGFFGKMGLYFDHKLGLSQTHLSQIIRVVTEILSKIDSDIDSEFLTTLQGKVEKYNTPLRVFFGTTIKNIEILTQQERAVLELKSLSGHTWVPEVIRKNIDHWLNDEHLVENPKLNGYLFQVKSIPHRFSHEQLVTLKKLLDEVGCTCHFDPSEEPGLGRPYWVVFCGVLLPEKKENEVQRLKFIRQKKEEIEQLDLDNEFCIKRDEALNEKYGDEENIVNFEMLYRVDLQLEIVEDFLKKLKI